MTERALLLTRRIGFVRILSSRIFIKLRGNAGSKKRIGIRTGVHFVLKKYPRFTNIVKKSLIAAQVSGRPLMFHSIKNKVKILLNPENNNPVARAFRDPDYLQNTEDRKAQILFLKLLMMISNLDENIDIEEINLIKDYAFENCLNESEWAEISSSGLSKTNRDEIENNVNILIGDIRSKIEKTEFLNAIEQIINADGVIKDEEKQLLEIIKNKVESHDISILSNFIRQTKKKLRSNAKNHTGESVESQQFSGNPVAPFLKTFLQNSENGLEIHGAKIGILLLLLRIDMDFARSELIALKLYLQNKLNTSEEKLNELLDTITKIPESNFQLTRLGRILSDYLSADDRRKFLTDAFHMAHSDKDFKIEEENYLRLIASSLMLSHKDFISSKLAAKI